MDVHQNYILTITLRLIMETSSVKWTGLDRKQEIWVGVINCIIKPHFIVGFNTIQGPSLNYLFESHNTKEGVLSGGT